MRAVCPTVLRCVALVVVVDGFRRVPCPQGDPGSECSAERGGDRVEKFRGAPLGLFDHNAMVRARPDGQADVVEEREFGEEILVRYRIIDSDDEPDR